jgi:hypothetical protein
MAIGFVVYFLYSRTHSRLATEPDTRTGPPEVVDVRDSTLAAREGATRVDGGNATDSRHRRH